jgi:hypothetical protein
MSNGKMIVNVEGSGEGLFYGFVLKNLNKDN